MKLEKNLDHSIITAFHGYLIISNWASNCEANSRNKKKKATFYSKITTQ